MFFGATHIEQDSRVLTITSRAWLKVGFAKLQGKYGSVELSGYSLWRFQQERNSKEFKIKSWSEDKWLEILCDFNYLSFSKLVIETSDIGSFKLDLRKKMKFRIGCREFRINSRDPISSNPIWLLRQLLCLGFLNFDSVVYGDYAKEAPEEIIIISILIRALISPVHYNS